MDFKDIWKRRFWLGLELVLDLDGVVGDGGRQLGEEGKVYLVRSVNSKNFNIRK